MAAPSLAIEKNEYTRFLNHLPQPAASDSLSEVGYLARGEEPTGFILPKTNPIYKDEEFLSKLAHEYCKQFRAMTVVQDHNTWERFRDEIATGENLQT
jgi:hypothetical protein